MAVLTCWMNGGATLRERDMGDAGVFWKVLHKFYTSLMVFIFSLAGTHSAFFENGVVERKCCFFVGFVSQIMPF